MLDANGYPRTIARDFYSKFHFLVFDRDNPKQYRDAVGDMNDQFKQALADAYLPGQNTSIQDKVWNLVWADGHYSGGYEDVEIMYKSCADLILFVIKTAKESQHVENRC